MVLQGSLRQKFTRNLSWVHKEKGEPMLTHSPFSTSQLWHVHMHSNRLNNNKNWSLGVGENSEVKGPTNTSTHVPNRGSRGRKTIQASGLPAQHLDPGEALPQRKMAESTRRHLVLWPHHRQTMPHRGNQSSRKQLSVFQDAV